MRRLFVSRLIRIYSILFWVFDRDPFLWPDIKTGRVHFRNSGMKGLRWIHLEDLATILQRETTFQTGRRCFLVFETFQNWGILWRSNSWPDKLFPLREFPNKYEQFFGGGGGWRKYFMPVFSLELFYLHLYFVSALLLYNLTTSLTIRTSCACRY